MEILLQKIRRQGITIQLIGDHLELTFPKDAQVDNVLEEIRQHKAALIAFIQASRQQIRPGHVVDAKASYFDLSPNQLQLFYRQVVDPDSTVYQFYSVLYLADYLHLEQVRRALQEVIRRHDILRSTFVEIDGRPQGIVLPTASPDLQDLRIYTDIDTVWQVFRQAFDLANGPLLRAALINTEEHGQGLLIAMHGLIGDGISMHILGHEFLSVYRGKRLSDQPLWSFASWSSTENIQQKIAANNQRWQEMIPEDFMLFHLPTDHIRPLRLAGDREQIELKICPELYGQLQAFADGMQVDQESVMLCIYLILLSELTGREDILIGRASYGRTSEQEKNMIGPFEFFAPIRHAVPAHQLFREFLQGVAAQSKEYDVQGQTDLDELRSALGIPWDSGRNPIFDIVFRYENLQDFYLNEDAILHGPFARYAAGTCFDLMLRVIAGRDHMLLQFNYITALFERCTIERIASNFEQIMMKVLHQPSGHLSSIRPATDAIFTSATAIL